MSKYVKYLKNPLIVSFLFLFFSIIFLSIFFNYSSRDQLFEQIQHRQQLATRTGAKSIENFFSRSG